MNSPTAVLLVGVALFTATNVDDIFILVSLFSDPRLRSRDIVIGQYLGIAALVSGSLLAAMIALVVPPAYIGILGLAPIAIGVSKLMKSWRDDDAPDDELPPRDGKRVTADVLAVAAVTIANGGDNLAVYTAAFAVRSGVEIAMMIAVFAIMTGVWCAFAHWLVHHETFGSPLRWYGQRFLPLVLIILGVVILIEARSFELLFK